MTAEQIEHEIARLHRFFVSWYAGEIPANSPLFTQEFVDSLAPDVEYIMPSGMRLNYESLVTLIREGRGSNPEFAITIADVRVRSVTAAGQCTVTYVEKQTGAKNSPAANARYSVAVLEPRSGGFLWRFIQETACP